MSDMATLRDLPESLSRDRRKAQTETRILDAAGRLLEEGRLEEASFSEIARLAGVGDRTVYRYYPTRDALMGAFWARLQTEGLPPRKPSMRRVRQSVRTEFDGRKPMRILIATDAWEPQVNGVVRTLTRVISEMQAMGHTVEVISPDQFRGFPLPTYPEIKVAVGAYESVRERFKAFEPEAIHIATEGPIGLAARDTLRLEMGFCLYGNDIDDSTSPLEAGLGWITKFTKDFTDSEYLKDQKEAGVTRKLVAFEMIDRGIPRHDYPILDANGAVIGKVTSGPMSPSMKIAIGLGYVHTSHSALDSEIFIEIREKGIKAKVVKSPFYKA
jgi:AcrR family transcriptional regulator